MFKKIYKTISAKASRYAESKMSPIDRLVVLKDKLVDGYEKVALSAITSREQLFELQSHRDKLSKEIQAHSKRFSSAPTEATQRVIAQNVLVLTRAIEQVDAKIATTEAYLEKLEPIKTDLTIRAESAINQLETARMIGEFGGNVDIPSIYDIDRMLVDLDVTVLESGSSVGSQATHSIEIDEIMEQLKAGSFKS